jgi:flagella basal body P-ring formation protein FlgA
MMFAIFLLTCCLNAPLEVIVDKDTLTVGAIVPLPASDPRSTVGIGFAPNPGLARRIQRYEILAKLQAAGMRVDDLEFPESILVRRRSEVLDPQQVKQVVLEAFVRQYPNASVELISTDVPTTQVGTGDVSLTAGLPAHFDPSQPVFVRVDIRNGSVSRTIFARTVVRIETVQPVLKNHVAANTELRDDDVEWKPAQLEAQGQVPTSLDSLKGMLAKRDLEPGQVVKTDLLYMPLYVKKGESVSVKATSGGVTIAATMIALAPGRLGDTIMVQHLSGSGTATARITGIRTLEAIKR